MSHTYTARIIYTGSTVDTLDETNTRDTASEAYAIGRKAIMSTLRGTGTRMVKESGHDTGATLTNGATRHAWDLYDADTRAHVGYAWVDVAEVTPCGEVYPVASHPFTCTLPADGHTEHADAVTDSPAVVHWNTAPVLHDAHVTDFAAVVAVENWAAAVIASPSYQAELSARREAEAADAEPATLAELEAARERAAANLAELFGDDEPTDDVERCHVCGEPNDYCQGHGETGDPRGWRIALAHDFGDHTECHAAGCEAAGTTEHADYPHEVGYLDSCAACVSGGCVCCYSESFAPCVSAECEARDDEPADGDDEQTYPEWTERPADDGRRFGGVLAVVVAVAVWFLAGAFAGLVSSPTAYASPVPVVTEDDPAWNCATMGDHECGPRAATPDVPAGCLPVPGRPGNTLWVMLTPSGSAGCQTGR